MDKPDFSKGVNGLLPAIAQDYETGDVLMLAWVNEEAWNNTLETGHATYWSRSRDELWEKGKTSGNVQLIQDIRIDCDNDAILYRVIQKGGAACHTGYRSCFYRQVEGGELRVIGTKVFDPDEVYGK